MCKAVALHHLLLTVIIGGIIVLTLYAGTCYPHTVQLQEERQRIAASSGEATGRAGRNRRDRKHPAGAVTQDGRQ